MYRRHTIFHGLINQFDLKEHLNHDERYDYIYFFITNLIVDLYDVLLMLKNWNYCFLFFRGLSFQSYFYKYGQYSKYSS